MLFKMAEQFTKAKPLSKSHKAKVVDNEDPEKLGRLKVTIQGLLEGSKEKLPWCYPHNPYAHGGNSKSASLNVPKVGSDITVVFPTGSIYQPFYTGYWHSKNNYNMSKFTKNYPKAYGSVDPSGNSIVHDGKEGSFEYIHKAEEDSSNSSSSGGSPSSSGADSYGYSIPTSDDPAIAEIITQLHTAVSDSVGQIVQDSIMNAPGIGNMKVSMTGPVTSAVQDAVQSSIMSAIGDPKGALNALLSSESTINSAVSQLASTITSGLTGEGFSSLLSNSLSGALGDISGLPGTIANSLTSSLTGSLSEGLQGALSGSLNSITSGLSGMLNNGLQGVLSGGLNNVLSGLTGNLGGALSSALSSGLGSALGGGLGSAFGGIGGSGSNKGKFDFLIKKDGKFEVNSKDQGKITSKKDIRIKGSKIYFN